ncbi:protein of unknown function DUF218, partial [Candidatus Magnetoovum chiemensis]
MTNGLNSDISEIQENLDAIVILSSSAREKTDIYPREELSGTAFLRFWRGIEFYKELKTPSPLFYSGGSPQSDFSIEAGLAKKYALLIGIKEDNFWTDSKSHNTYESGQEILRQLRIKYPQKDKFTIAL